MAEATQKDRILELDTPLGKDVLLIRRLSGTETMSGPFRFRLEVESKNKTVDPGALIGKGVTVRLEIYNEDNEVLGHRFFHGMVHAFGKVEQNDDLAFYRAEVVPWFELLTHTADCRIFQDQTVPEIIKQIFDEWKSEYGDLVAYEDKTDASKYRPLDYCVQYRETDFDFISRLMEREAIYYYYTHEDKKHTLVFADGTDNPACPVRDKVRYEQGDEGDVWAEPEDSALLSLATTGLQTLQSEGSGLFNQKKTEVTSQITDGFLSLVVGGIFGGIQFVFSKVLELIISRLKEKRPKQLGVKVFRMLQDLRAGKYCLRDHHFELPDKNLEVLEVTNISVGSTSKLEIFDYPGEYAQRFNKPGERLDEVEQEGKKLVKLRMEETETPHWIISGISRESAFTAGHHFELTEHQDKAVNGRYLLTFVEHNILQGSKFWTGDDTETYKHGGPYRNRFACIPRHWPYRPIRKTPKPIVKGMQTGVVDGKEDEEIWVDKYGRIRVKFHWDREWDQDANKRHEHASCLVRVSQPWAGKRWGAAFWPRIGQEVVVAFLEGDPDRPLVVGSVYNFDQMPPYLGEGPDGKHAHNPHISGFKTCSTKGGEGFNELRFDDTKDEEQLFIQAEKDMDTIVQHHAREVVFFDQHLVVGHFDTKTRELKGNQHHAVLQDRNLIVLRHDREHIAGSMEIKIGGARDQYADAQYADAFAPVSDGGNLSIVVCGSKHESIGGDRHLIVSGDRFEKIDGNQNLIIAGDQQERAASHALETSGEIHLVAGTKVVIEAPQISLKSGGNFVNIDPAGVAIQGTLVLINSGGAPASGAPVNPVAAKGAKEAEPEPPEAPDELQTAKSGFPSIDVDAKSSPKTATYALKE
ncbi:MAG: type VI secretion system Vgr family protein [Pirellulaceae bacterium]